MMLYRDIMIDGYISEFLLCDDDSAYMFMSTSFDSNTNLLVMLLVSVTAKM